MVRPTSLEPENALLPTEQPERKTKSVMPEFTNALAPTEASPDGVPGENGLLQPLNALIPMEVSPSGNVMSVSAAHPWANARSASSSAAAPAVACTGAMPNEADSATGG